MAKKKEAKHEGQPISKVVWRDRNELKPNNYNPNRVASTELKLLKISIIEDGWTQPIVVNPDLEIVDGFHRWTVSGDADIFKLTAGLVPTVMTTPKDESSQKMATIRHNRARGTHGVLNMADIVQSLIEQGLSQQEIMARLQMEAEEVIRLASRVGIPKSKLIQDDDFSQAWEV
ncbi:ParB N-terminal domain-containing protein [Endozoicomonas sp. SESOKO1]|uniref:ParB N-terminal domain-containing protein n=1 Tax=Endozoicomonas sp. SESOKO1 TaxID=2828742 RepID=UPI002147C2FE|nr:ParB N-terminal domain-containing protein [Endozoicomonas sp. SESOKO1]